MGMDHYVQVSTVVRRSSGSVVRVQLTGELDTYATPAVRAALDSAPAGPVEVDQSGVTFLSATVVAVLLSAVKHGERAVRFHRPSDQVRRICKASGLAPWLAPEADEPG